MSGRRIMGNDKPSKTVVSGHVTDQGEKKNNKEKKKVYTRQNSSDLRPSAN